jgi:peptidoglycan/LPS O-acetylase OafA/YrhL
VTAQRNNFDALRLIGALLVLGSHQFALSGRWEPRVAGDHSFGNLGVLIFFAVSGFLVTQSWLADPHLGRFAARRALRLMPGLLGVMVLSGIALALLKPGGFAWREYLLAPWSHQRAPYFPGHAHTVLNGSLWTILVEVKCYILLCAAGALARRHLRTVVAATSACLLGWYLLGLGGQAGFDAAAAQGRLSFVPYFGAFFLLGAALALWPPLQRATGSLVAVGALCFAIGQPTLGLVLVVPTAVVWIGQRSWPVLRDAGRHGDISYGVYLYAWPTQQFIVAALGAGTAYLTLLLPSLAVALLFGLASWHLIEARALRLKPRRPLNALVAAAP